MKQKIALAKSLDLPLDAVTQTFGFIGRKGSGKTYAAGKFAEGLHGVGAPFIALDPVGNWWALRVDADGESPGLSVPVFGGQHGDLPLTPDIGSLVARIIIERRISAVIDVSTFRKNERKKFVTEFAEELFHQAKNVRSPRMVIFEEAQVFAPQRAKGEERMLGAVEDIVRLGRNYGLGSALISQRPQSVNKEVLNQVECLLVGQLNAYHEREAIKDWIVEKGQNLDYVEELPSLPQGTMFLWSPQWLGKFERVEIARKKTYDASATPKLGESLVVRELAPVDIEALNEAFQEAMQTAKDEDPKLLREHIRVLQKKLATSSGAIVSQDCIVEVPVATFTEQDDKLLRRFASDLSAISHRWDEAGRLLEEAAEKAVREQKEGLARLKEIQGIVEKALGKLPRQLQSNGSNGTSKHEAELKIRQEQDRKVFQALDAKPGKVFDSLPKVERLMLVAFAQHDPRPLNVGQVAVFAGYSPKTSGVLNGLGALRTKGFIEGDNKSMRILPAGKAVVGRFEPLPTGQALADRWCKKLGKANRSLLQVIVDAHPNRVNKDHVAEVAGYSPKTSSVLNGLGKLRSLHLIHGGNDAMVADESLIG